MSALLALLALAQAPGEQGEPMTIGDLVRSGPPTFVVGTAGDDASDRLVEGQARFVRDLLFADAPIVRDVAIDTSQGAAGWPERPFVYGGAHVNALLAEVADELPFRIEAGRLAIAGEELAGDALRLVALVPSAPPSERGPGHPCFALYAATGTPGVTEINAISDRGRGFVVADAFGALLLGGFERGADGAVRARIDERMPRLEWRSREHPLGARAAERPRVRIARLALVPERGGEAAEDAACLRGARAVVARAGIERPIPFTIHLHPDRGSKRRLTGNAGDGHADAGAAALHVLALDPAEGGPLESLVAHEASHVLVPAAWGPAGSALFGEGLAVWIAGRYGGRSLDDGASALPDRRPSVADLLGPRFRELPEAVAYPLGGLLVRAIARELGIEALREHLWPATASTWAEACRAAGSSPAAIEALLAAELDS